MRRHVIIGRYGPGDRSRFSLGDGEVETRLDLVVGERTLDHGIGRAIGDLKQMEGDYEVYAMAAPTDAKTPGREFFDMLQSKYNLKAKWTVSAVQGLGQALIAMRAIEAAAKKVGPDKITGEAVREALISNAITPDDTFKILGNIKFSNDAPFPTQGMVASIATVKGGKYTEAAENVPVPTLNKW